MSRRLAISTLVVITVIWGTTFAIVKDAVASVPVPLFLALRFSVAALALSWVRPRRATAMPAVILGLLAFAGFGTQTIGLSMTGASKAAFITGLSVILTPLLSAFWFRERVPLKAFLAATVALLGLGFMTLTGAESGVNSGDLWVLGTALSYALYVVYLGTVAKRHAALTLGAMQLWPMALLAWLWALPLAPEVVTLAPASWAAIVYLALIATALISVLQVQAQKVVPAYLAALIFILEPVFAAVFAYLYLGETLGRYGLLGAALVLAAMLVSELPWKGRKIARHKPESP